MEEGGGAAFSLDGGAVEPGVAAERGDHLVEEGAAALLGGLAGGRGRRGAGDVGSLGAGELGREQDCGEGGEDEALHARFIFAGVQAARCWTLAADGRLRGQLGLDDLWHGHPTPLYIHTI